MVPLGLSPGRDGLLYVPQGVSAERPAPLIVALHGAGGDALNVLGLFTAAAEREGVLVLAPDSRGRTWDVILGGYGPDVAFLDRALDDLFGRFTVDPGRIAAAGFSDGASYALSLGLTNGDLFGAVLAFSPGFMAPASRTGAPGIFISHGTRDEVLPIERCSRRLAPALRAAGYELDYLEFDGGHVVPPEMTERALGRFVR